MLTRIIHLPDNFIICQDSQRFFNQSGQNFICAMESFSPLSVLLARFALYFRANPLFFRNKAYLSHQTPSQY